MHRPVLDEEALLEGAPEDGSVRDRRAEVRVPGVEMRIEVHEGDQAVELVHRAQQGQGDRVVPADRDEARPVGEHVPSVVADLVDRDCQLERVDRHVAGVDDLHVLEGRQRQVRVAWVASSSENLDCSSSISSQWASTNKPWRAATSTATSSERMAFVARAITLVDLVRLGSRAPLPAHRPSLRGDSGS